MLSIDFRCLQFPVFPIKKSASLSQEGGILYASTARGMTIVDNKNLDAGTLGRRRLKLLNAHYELYHLKPTITTPQELLYAFTRYDVKCFIDNLGTLYKPVPTEFYTIQYKKILRVKQLDKGGCSIQLEGISCPMPYPEYRAGIENGYAEVVLILGGHLIRDLVVEPGTRVRIKL